MDCITAAGRGKHVGSCEQGAGAAAPRTRRTGWHSSGSSGELVRSQVAAQASCSNRKVAVGGCDFHCCAAALAAATVGGGLYVEPAGGEGWMGGKGGRE
jgi:hypothetical protein